MSYYLFPFEKVTKNSRIVLYGSGKVGKAFYEQVDKMNYCKIILWLDKNADESFTKLPEAISNIDSNSYDFVIIAIENEAITNDVKTFLISSGVPENKILHKIHFYKQIKSSKPSKPSYPIEFTDDEKEIIDYIVDNGLSMVSRERLFATLMSCKYALENNIEGDFVECGVWRGGNSIIAAWMFKLYRSNKKVYLCDTFDGMTAPTEDDIKLSSGEKAKKLLEKASKEETDKNIWCYASLDDVKNNFKKANLLHDNIVFIKGDVLQTLGQNNLPEKIAVLRLDTDWYESTKKEMEVLYPRITQNGILMIDDYGYWSGSKKAVDEYFKNERFRHFFHYIDCTGRLVLKI